MKKETARITFISALSISWAFELLSLALKSDFAAMVCVVFFSIIGTAGLTWAACVRGVIDV